MIWYRWAVADGLDDWVFIRPRSYKVSSKVVIANFETGESIGMSPPPSPTDAVCCGQGCETASASVSRPGSVGSPVERP